VSGIRRHSKAHAALHGSDIKMGEQRGQVGIVEFVLDDEADIDGKPGPIVVDATVSRLCEKSRLFCD